MFVHVCVWQVEEVWQERLTETVRQAETKGGGMAVGGGVANEKGQDGGSGDHSASSSKEPSGGGVVSGSGQNADSVSNSGGPVTSSGDHFVSGVQTLTSPGGLFPQGAGVSISGAESMEALKLAHAQEVGGLREQLSLLEGERGAWMEERELFVKEAVKAARIQWLKERDL